MAKFYGQIGFVKTEEEADTGLTLPVVTERDYYGDVNRVVRRW